MKPKVIFFINSIYKYLTEQKISLLHIKYFRSHCVDSLNLELSYSFTAKIEFLSDFIYVMPVTIVFNAEVF